MDHTLSERPEPRAAHVQGQRVALVDLLDRLLAGGVVITGDLTISIANVDLVQISLRALIASIRPEMHRAMEDDRARTIRGTIEREDTAP
jgi:hypothetical protein